MAGKRIAVIDVDRMKFLTMGDLVFCGGCKRCGRCCSMTGCKELGVENVDGVPRHFCKIYFDRPARCALWPLPEDPVPQGCGFWWEELS